VHFFEHLEHADVRAALGAAAGEHQADARAVRRVGRNGIMTGFARLRRRSNGGQQNNGSDE